MIVVFNYEKFKSVLQMSIATSSVRKLADKIGMNYVTLYRMAYHGRKPRMNEFVEICTAMSIEPYQFFITIGQDRNE